jgi:hypothetical protein
VVVQLGSSMSVRTSSGGKYHRTGEPLSGSIRGRVDSASTTSSTVTRTERELRKTSMRVYGSRGWTKTSSSSSNTVNESQSKAIRPAMAAALCGGCCQEQAASPAASSPARTAQ